MNATAQRRSARPIRLTLAAALGHDIDGAWWPHTALVSGELPQLVDALRTSLGDVVAIDVNWSPSDGVPDLDSLTRRGVTAIPGWTDRQQRVMTVTGGCGRANLLVVPSRTSAALAVMVLRYAAALPIDAAHLETPAYRAAYDIVRAARAECAQRTTREKPISP